MPPEQLECQRSAERQTDQVGPNKAKGCDESGEAVAAKSGDLNHSGGSDEPPHRARPRPRP